MYLWRKKLYALVFLPAIFLLAGLNLYHAYPQLKETLLDSAAAVREGGMAPAAVIVRLEDTMVAGLYGRMNYIEGYSYLQKLLDKREFGNFSYIEDEQGMLHYASFYREPDRELFSYACRVKRLQDYVSPYGTKVLFAIAPAKYVPSTTQLRSGLPANDPQTRVAGLLFYLNRLGVATLDFNQYLPNESLSYAETFFRTDHHWTVPAAFAASQLLAAELNRLYGAALDPENYYLDAAQYDAVTYKNVMLGSMGRRTGANFAGLEDFTALWPRFAMRYRRESLAGDHYARLEGETVGTLILPEVLAEGDDIYSGSAYSLYLNALRDYERIQNLDNPAGPTLLLLRDSYFSPVIVFLAPLFSEIHAIWLLEENDRIDMEEYVRSNRFDYIVIETYPYNITDAAFSFFAEGG